MKNSGIGTWNNAKVFYHRRLGKLVFVVAGIDTVRYWFRHSQSHIASRLPA